MGSNALYNLVNKEIKRSVNLQFGGIKKNIGIGGIEAELNLSFERKLGSVNAKASAIIKRFDGARDALIDACGQLERDSSLPDIDYISNSVAMRVAEQKKVYTSALKRILSGYKVEEKKNLYMSHLATLEGMKGMLDEVLKLNGKFRMVLEGYANSLGRFRSSFSLMERLAKEMDSIVSSKEKEFKEYNEILGEIERLRAFSEELGGLSAIRSRKAIKSGVDGRSAEMEMLKSLLAKKSAELDLIERSIDGVSMEILHITSPIEKAARKYAHGIASSARLLAYISDPVGTIAGNPDAMKDFMMYVESLRKEIASGRILVKNQVEAVQALELVMKGNLGALVDEIAILKAKEGPIMLEIGSIKKDMDRIDREAEHNRAEIKESEALEEKLRNLSKAMSLSKSKIEELFSRYYRMQISLDL